MRPNSSTISFILLAALVSACSNGSGTTGSGGGAGSAHSASSAGGGGAVACGASVCLGGEGALSGACDGKDQVTCGLDADGCPVEIARQTCANACDPTSHTCCGETGQACCNGTDCVTFNACGAGTCALQCAQNYCTDHGFTNGVHCKSPTQQIECFTFQGETCPQEVNATTCDTGCDDTTGTCGGCPPNQCLSDWGGKGNPPILCTSGPTALQCGFDQNGCPAIVSQTHCNVGCVYGSGCQ